MRERVDVSKKAHAMSNTRSSARLLVAKHAEFEKAAAEMDNSQRRIERTPRGIQQHVVKGEGDAVLRWPTSYEHGEKPNTYAKTAS